MTTRYRHLESPAEAVQIPDDGILSRTLEDTEHVKLVLFAFSPGQELSEHTSTKPAVIQIVEGEAELGLDGATHLARAGAWTYMAPQLRHSVRAVTPCIMLLTLIKEGAGVEQTTETRCTC